MASFDDIGDVTSSSEEPLTLAFPDPQNTKVMEQQYETGVAQAMANMALTRSSGIDRSVDIPAGAGNTHQAIIESCSVLGETERADAISSAASACTRDETEPKSHAKSSAPFS